MSQPTHAPHPGPDRAGGGPGGPAGPERLCVLAVDDEAPALDELQWLLRREDRIGEVLTADSGTEALRILHERHVDAIFMDVQMPGLTGLDLARVLSKFQARPPVVFVTAHEQHAVDAFELDVVDYVLKPVRDERLAEAVRRVVTRLEGTEGQSSPGEVGSEDEGTILVELAGVSRLIQRSDVRFVEAQGDYARLHTDQGSHLVRVPLSTLAEEWADAGFVRVHRSYLVAIAQITEWRTEAGRTTVLVGGREIGVSRRHARDLRDLLMKRAQKGRGTP